MYTGRIHVVELGVRSRGLHRMKARFKWKIEVSAEKELKGLNTVVRDLL